MLQYRVKVPMAQAKQSDTSQAKQVKSENYAVMDMQTGKLFYEEESMSLEEAKNHADRMGENASHTAVQVEYTVYHEFDNSEARQEVETYNHEEIANQLVIDNADEYQHPGVPYEGVVEKEIEIKHWSN